MVAPQIEEGRLRTPSAAASPRSRRRSSTRRTCRASRSSRTRRTSSGSRATRRARRRPCRGAGPELIFRNDWDAPLVMLVEAGGSASPCGSSRRTSNRRVEYGEGDPTDFKEPRAAQDRQRELEPGTEQVVQESGRPGSRSSTGARCAAATTWSATRLRGALQARGHDHRGRAEAAEAAEEPTGTTDGGDGHRRRRRHDRPPIRGAGADEAPRRHGRRRRAA